MRYDLIALFASILLAGKFAFATPASLWSKILIVGLVLVSLAWSYGVFLQAGIVILLSFYFTYQKARGS